MKSYTLYLDESLNKETNTLIVAGIAVEKGKINFLNNRISDIKKMLWSGFEIPDNDYVLHCTELSVIKNNRRNPRLDSYIKRDSYQFLGKLNAQEIKDRIDSVTNAIARTIELSDIIVLGCAINRLKYQFYYPAQIERDDEYSIALETIIENYVHFLKQNNAVGDVLYESRDSANTADSPDVQMKHNFQRIIVNNKGIISIKQSEVLNRIRDFNTISKKEAVSGIEISDYVAFHLAKAVNTDDAQKSIMIKAIEKKIYNGTYSLNDRDVRNFFGLREFPFDYELITSQKNEIIRLKRALKNKKSENSKLNKKVDKLIAEKRELENDFRTLQNQVDSH